MIRLQEITLREIRLAAQRAVSHLLRRRHRAPHLLLELADADGVDVWASASPASSRTTAPRRSTPRGMRSRNGCAARARHVDSTPRTMCTRLLDRNIRGHNMAKAAVEMGCWGARRATGGRAALEAARRHARPRPDGHLDRHSEVSRSARRARTRARSRRAIARSSSRSSRARRRVRARRARGARPDAQLMADANSAYTLADADHPRAARPVQPHHARAAARPRRPRASRAAAAAC